MGVSEESCFFFNAFMIKGEMMDALTVRGALELAVMTEQTGERFYRRLASRFAQTPEVAKVFDMLAKEEVGHEAQFKKLVAQIDAEDRGIPNYDYQAFLKATAITEFFKPNSEELRDDLSTAKEALERAIAFEKTTKEFYEKVMETTGPNKLLQELVDEEARHVETLTKALSKA